MFPISPCSKSSRYFHQSVNQAFRFIVPEGKSLLYYGRYLPGLLPDLDSSRCVVVSHIPAAEEDLPSMVKERVEFVHSEYNSYTPEETFDYIILNGAPG